MAGEDKSLRSVYEKAEQKRQRLDNTYDSNSTTFQANLSSAIELYEQCLQIASSIALFSSNESLEDISSVDLPYLLLSFRLANLLMRINGQNRKNNLRRAQESYERYLRQLDDYDVLSKADKALMEQYQDEPLTFSTTSTSNPAARRDGKIKRFKEERALKQKLEYMEQNKMALANDDNIYRELQLTNLAYCTYQSFQSLESIAQELHILSLAPPSPPPETSQHATDRRDRDSRKGDGYSERLDAPHLSAGMRGPLLDGQGKPLRPFTLTSKRQEVRNGVFRPDHSLPTMSIDEYLEEERRRGGMIDGGGPQSEVTPQVDEDDMDAADVATMKAREWDEYVEANPKGSGNTLNRG